MADLRLPTWAATSGLGLLLAGASAIAWNAKTQGGLRTAIAEVRGEVRVNATEIESLQTASQLERSEVRAQLTEIRRDLRLVLQAVGQ